MQIYNTYTRKKESFTPIEENKLKMYVCGPTVYDYIHIGNARPVIFFDVVRRYFTAKNYEVDYVSNITDVDDKIINKAVAEGISEVDVSEKYLAQYLADCKALNVQPLRAMPKVTENIAEIVEFINDLVQKGFAYEVDGDVYFRVRKANDYGKLSGKKIEDLIVGARVETNTKKEDPLDFTLWKNTAVGITWDSPWGSGRPGWHTECVVMIEEEFGGKIDIHGGGSDLQFPHHENEIAQSICGAGHPIANTWMHVGRLGLDNEKMSKSIGNVILVKDLLQDWDANVFRLFILSTHYRKPLNFSYETLESTKREWEKIERTYKGLHRYIDLADAWNLLEKHNFEVFYKKELEERMDDDFNTANVISSLYALTVEVNINILRYPNKLNLAIIYWRAIKMFFNVLGFEVDIEKLSTEDIELYRDWEQAREDKNFELADELRSRLQERELI